MDLTRTALTVAVAICTAATVYGQTTSTQAHIDAIATNLEVKIIMRTNHFLFGSHSVQFYLRNTGSSPILNMPDWIIRFQMKNKLFDGTNRHTQYGLEVLPDAGCHYIIKPDPNAALPYSGLGANASTTFTVPATGLSVFKTDVFPKFIVYSTTAGLTAKTIVSTNDPKMEFVYINSVNVSRTDPSLTDGMSISLNTANVFDQRGVPISTLIPVPANITIGILGQLPPPVIELNGSVWYIWATEGVSQIFLERLRDAMRSLPDMDQRIQIFKPNATANITVPPANTSLINVVLSQTSGYTVDHYTLTIGNNGTIDYIHMEAATDEGFANALSSLMGITGLFNSAPHLSISDDARFGHRSIELDLTKNFFPKETIFKLLNVMSMYKLNNLVMHMADNNGWRLEMPASMDFEELTAFGGRRCKDESSCLPPMYGSGADNTTSGSGFYTIVDFKEILSEANKLKIRVTPKINFMGSLGSAIDASHKRYMRLKTSNLTEADRLHLMSSNYPTITEAEKSVETCYTHGVLDPCNPATANFIADVVTAIMGIYHELQIPLLEFHAGGDETTEYMHWFSNCNDPLRRMLKEIQGILRPDEFLRVSEEAVFDPATATCLTGTIDYNINRMIVDFKKIYPSDHRTWNMTEAHVRYLMAPVSQPVNGVGTDPLRPVTFQPLGDAPWSIAYKCANMDYKVILAPESLYSLDIASQLDFNERGNRDREHFFTANFHRVLTFEPFDIYGAMSITADRYRVLPYRLTKIFNSPRLAANKKHNIIGLEATVDTSIISSEDMLWDKLFPRLLPIADAAWRKRMFEGVLDQNDPNTLINMTLVQYHASVMEMELNRLSNTYAYKEMGRLDAINITYQIDRPGASINFALRSGAGPPFPVIVTTSTPGVDVQYREVYGSNRQWRTLFHRNRVTNTMEGGQNASFPFNPSQPRAIDIRILSDDYARAGMPTRLEFNTYSLFPREVPAELRGQTCLPIYEPWRTSLEDITLAQWNQIMYNIALVRQDRENFEESHETHMNTYFLTLRQGYSPNSPFRNIGFNETIQMIEQLVATNQMATRTSPDLYRDMYNRDLLLLSNREQLLMARLQTMETAYQTCVAVANAAAAAANTG